MNDTSKMILTVVVVTVITSVLGYFLGFAGLFAHSMMEIFYYAGLFGGVQVLTLMISAWWKGGRPVPVIQTKNTAPTAPNYQA